MIVAITVVRLDGFFFDSFDWFLTTAVVSAQLEVTDVPHPWERRLRVKASREIITLAAHRVAESDSALVLLGLNAGHAIGRGTDEGERIRRAAKLAGYEDPDYWYRTYASALVEAIAHQTFLLALQADQELRTGGHSGRPRPLT